MMNIDKPVPAVYLSALDKERFGFNIAKAMQMTANELPAFLEFCHTNQVEMLISRCSTDDIDTVHAMERAGFLLMDTLVYDVFNINKKPIPSDTPSVTIRTFRPSDIEQIQSVAESAFENYFGHYHVDKRLETHKSIEVYTSWAKRSCESRDVANEIIVAEDNGKVVGFSTLQIKGEQEGELVIAAVHQNYQGRGIFRSCTIATLQWFFERQIPIIWLSMLLNNIPMRKMATRVGFEPSHSFYTFHKWFDE